MKRIFYSLFIVIFIMVWCSPGFAFDGQTITGSTPINLSGTNASAPGSGTGVTGGVEMVSQGSGGTLNVGTQDIFTENELSSGVAINSLLPAITTDVASESNIVFNGTSTVYGYIGGAQRFLNITAGAGTNTDTFLGAVNTTAMNVGTGTVNFESGTANTVSAGTTFTGDGTISLSANTTVTGALFTNTAGTGTLDLASNSQLTGAVGGASGLKDISVVGGTNSSGVSATIVGAVDTYKFSLGTNTLNINGALTIGTNGVIDTTLYSSSIYGHVIVVGGASGLGTGLAIDVNIPTTSLIVPGNEFTVVQGSGTGALATVTDPTNPLYKFSIVNGPNGQAEIKTDSVPLQVASNPVVPVLLGISLTAGLTSVLTAINALTDPAAVINAVAQLNPSATSLAAPLVTFQGAREFENLWLSRLDMCSQFSRPYDDTSNCQENDPHGGWWAKGFGYFGNQQDQGAFSGYSSSIFGTMIAYDTPLGPDTRAGLGFGYAHTTIDGNTYNTNTEFDSYQPTVYIGHEQGPWYINGSESVGINQYSGMRNIVFPGVDLTAKSEYDGQDYTTYLNSGYHIAVPQQFVITPLASLQYSRVNLDSYTETGAGDIDLHAKPQGYDFLESGLGAKVERGFGYHNWTLIPDLHFKWLYDFLNPTQGQTANFTAPGSPSFYTTGLKTSPDTYNVGAAITLLSCVCSKKTWSIEAGYDYFIRDDGYTANQVTMKLTIGF